MGGVGGGEAVVVAVEIVLPAGVFGVGGVVEGAACGGACGACVGGWERGGGPGGGGAGEGEDGAACGGNHCLSNHFVDTSSFNGGEEVVSRWMAS